LIADATADVVAGAGPASPNRLLLIEPVSAPVSVPAPAPVPVLASLSPPGFVAVVPGRLMDSRVDGVTVDGAVAGGGVRGAGSVTQLRVVGRGGVAVGASAVVLNVTVAQARGVGFVSVFPCGGDRPNGSNLNFVVGETVANAVVAKVGVDGTVCVFTYAPTDLIVDVAGYFPLL